MSVIEWMTCYQGQRSTPESKGNPVGAAKIIERWLRLDLSAKRVEELRAARAGHAKRGRSRGITFSPTGGG